MLEGNDSWVWSVVIARDGDRVISGGADRTVRTWQINSAQLARRVCDVVGGDLRQDEWAEFFPSDVPYERTCSEELEDPT